LENNLAVLIDFENVAAGAQKEGLGRFDVSLVMDRFREKGRILVARSYADWGRFARFKKGLLMEQVQLFELTSHGMNDKNRADVALVVDCMELAFTKDYIDTFVIISGDSDFTPLVMKLKELNKRVIGCGTRRSTSRLIVEACDEFIFYDSLARESSGGRTRSRRRRPVEPAATTEEFSLEDSLELVVETLVGLRREGAGAIHGSRLKQAMMRKERTFSESDLGHSSFIKFLEFCSEEGLLLLHGASKAGGYLVELAETDEAEEEAPFGYVGNVRDLYLRLRSLGFETLTPQLRREVATTVVDHMADRSRRSRRATVAWVAEDVARLIRKQKPELKGKTLRNVVLSMHKAGAFLHGDGGPVRSTTATCVLQADANKLVAMVDALLVRALLRDGLNLAANSADVADLVLGSPEMAKKVEVLAAWQVVEPDTDPEPRRELSVAVEEEGETALDSEEASAQEEPRRRRRTRRKRKDVPVTDESTAVETDSAEEVVAEGTPAADSAPPAEPTAEPSAVREPEPATAATLDTDSPTEVQAPGEEPATRKPRRRRVRGKNSEGAASLAETTASDRPTPESA
jgi:hypothetical protein